MKRSVRGFSPGVVDCMDQATEHETASLAEKVAEGRAQILGELRKVIVGQDEVVDEVLMALFCGGHCLITGVPGQIGRAHV